MLGPLRILWVAPRIGTRMAELWEAPIMLVTSIVAARQIVRRMAVPLTLSNRLGMGAIALGLMLIAEFTLVLWLRGLSISQYLAARDSVAEAVYHLMLVIFAALPLFSGGQIR